MDYKEIKNKVSSTLGVPVTNEAIALIVYLALKQLNTPTKEVSVSKKEIKDIKDSLMMEYTKSETDEMIKNATIQRSAKGVNVTYDNGCTDKFITTTNLVHTQDLV